MENTAIHNNEKTRQVSICPCGSYDAAEVRKSLTSLLRPIGGLDFVKPGMTVAIKVNMVSSKKPETATTTNPVLLAELCRMLQARGAKVILGDSPGGPYRAAMLRNAYKVCGYQPLQELGVILNEDVSVKETTFTQAVSIKTFQYTAWLDEADCIINFCKLKTHAMMNMTCAVKNFFGTIPGTTKAEYHMRFPDYQAFANMMIDLQEYFKPVLHIVDAVDCMEGNGPTSGEPRHMGLLLASRKPYDLDVICAHLIGMEFEEVPTLVAAAARGLGSSSYEEARHFITGADPEDFVIKDFKRNASKYEITFINFGPAQKLVKKAMQSALATRPQVKKQECIGCKRCHDICPAKAITMKNKLPVIDRSKCIRCFCCQEFCPVGAMKVHRKLIGRMLEH